MDVRELRIGNKVLYGKTTPREISLLMSDGRVGVDLLIVKNETIDPITLTPEIVEKCGFTLHSKHSFWNYTTKNGFHIGMWAKDKPCAGFEEKGVFYWGETPDVTLRYLHQLQNLYYFLTNKELQITL